MSAGRPLAEAAILTPVFLLVVFGIVEFSTELSSSSKYSDRKLTLLVDLPTSYATLYGTRAWWKIRYTTTSSSVTDRTTWGASITGDPVHLVS